jgi:hypothetical protein
MPERIELNVTAFGVTPTDKGDPPLDQTSELNTALKYLGGQFDHGQGIKYYSNTAYIPAGTYFISSAVFQRLIANGQNAKVTIRGDGIDATTLMIGDSAYAGDRFDAFSQTPWVRSRSITGDENSAYYLKAKAQGGTGTHDTKTVSVKCQPNAKIHFRYLTGAGWKNGMKLRVFRDSTQVFINSSGPLGIGQGDADLTTTSGGTFDVKFQFEDGGGSTADTDAYIIEKIWLENAFDTTEQTVFEIRGDGSTYSTGFTLKDIHLDGGLMLDNNFDPEAGTDRPVQWFYLDLVARLKMDSVTMDRTYGRGIYAQQWRDSVLHFVSFAQVGKNTASERPGMELASHGAASAATACANLTFQACRWDNSQYTACLLKE